MQHGPLEMRNRMKFRNELGFDHDRTLKFDKRTIMHMAERDFYFERWRRLHYEIIIEGVFNKTEQAKQLNIQGVALFKEGKLSEAKWCFEKALSIDPNYENARKNQRTITKKLKKNKQKKRSMAKKGKKLSHITEELRQEPAQTRDHYQYQAQPQYATTEQPHRESVEQPWQRNFRCPGCSVPVRDNWLICTNCGTDLRRYPPIPY